MTLIFNIEYRTSWGEEVRVLGSIPELGNNQPNKATPRAHCRRHSLDRGSGYPDSR